MHMENTLFNLIKETVNEVLAERAVNPPEPWGFTDRPSEVPPDWAEGPMEPIPLPQYDWSGCPENWTEEECEAWHDERPQLPTLPGGGQEDWDSSRALEEINRMVDKTVDRVISKKRPSTPGRRKTRGGRK